MDEKRISLEEMMELSIGEMSQLAINQFYYLFKDAEEDLAHAQKVRQWVIAAIAMKYEAHIEAKRLRTGSKTGTIHIDDDGFRLTTNLPNKPSWDQKKLSQIVADIEKQGDNPKEYVEISTKYTVPENKYKAWPESIRNVFKPARVPGVGSATYAITSLDKEAA